MGGGGHHGRDFFDNDSFVSVHVVPVDDLIEHDSDSDDCVCGPDVEPLERDDGSMAWMYVHHSLDGREADE